ncbi:uncharacterized protein DNG_09705 [Cephalotrichum gorgonifer]|uniref:Protein kinase domain-containing protein n=1 Tax=Cephalotrichum gorgonifer TaxID=2041049 RepID=A0AAE8N674_9PEZI|nr:uncharacterized protein DNG_09705 [Cephalotrichum gorgonifer]
MKSQAALVQREGVKRCWDGNIYGLRKIGQGGTAFVFDIDETAVVKVPIGFPASISAFEREREVYHILAEAKNESPYVLKCFQAELRSGLVLERCQGSVRDELLRMHMEVPHKFGDAEATERAIRWSFQAASGLGFLHSRGIIQADVGCHNMLLDERDNLKISDFSGSVIERTGEDALVSYSVHSQLPGVSKADRRTDIFALGSAMYEMATGRVPLEDLSPSQVRRRFKQAQWPDMTRLKDTYVEFALVIEGCWNLEFRNVNKAAARIELAYYDSVELGFKPPISNQDLTEESWTASQSKGRPKQKPSQKQESDRKKAGKHHRKRHGTQSQKLPKVARGVVSWFHNFR